MHNAAAPSGRGCRTDSPTVLAAVIPPFVRVKGDKYLSRIIEKDELKKERYKLNSVTEYKFGKSTYIVKTYFDLDCEESLEDVVQRLITKEVEKAMSA